MGQQLKVAQDFLFVWLSRVRKWPEFGALIGFLTLFVGFSIFSSNFFTFLNLTGVFTTVSELGIITIGVTFLMITGEFDLSVSSVFALSGFIFVRLADGTNSLVAAGIALAVAALIGYINATITLRARIPSFITTLGMMIFLRGILLGITGGETVIYDGDSIVPKITSRFIELPFGLGDRFRPSHIWFIALTLLFSFVLLRTRYGNWVYATGGRKEVARAMGVNVDRVKTINFMLTSMLAGLAGIIVISRFRLANVSLGTGIELEAIAAAVIGGTLLFGGFGTIFGAYLGVSLVGMTRNGLILAGAPAFWFQTFVGLILVIAATINTRLRRLDV